jgi:hypothetical protein
MQAVSRKPDNSNTIVPANPGRRRESGWTTLNKIRLPKLKIDWKNTPDPPWYRTLKNLTQDYVIATEYVKG